MFSDIKGNHTLIIVLHEIYGINRHIEEVCKYFSQCGYDVVCPDLTGEDKLFQYSQQQEAYKYFVENIGFESAYEKVKKLIIDYRNQYKDIFVIGFSIGATIAWLCSGLNELCSGIIGVYGSRIRDYTNVTPRCPVMLVFPAHESPFEVGTLIGILDKNVETHILEGEHGFADPYGKSFNKESSEKLYALIRSFVQKSIK